MKDAVRFQSFPDSRGSTHDYEETRTQAAEFIRTVGADMIIAVSEHTSGPGMLTVTVWYRAASQDA